MIQLSLVCDSCGAIIAEGISANEVRLQSDAANNSLRVSMFRGSHLI